MATVVSAIIEPDVEVIKGHLETLFGVAREDYPGGLIELRYGQDAKLDRFAYFGMSAERIAEAADFAANRNKEGCNVYVGVNPRKPSTDTRRAGSTPDIEISFWHFADIDDAEAVTFAVERSAALKPTMTVTTGTAPHKRPHLYWQIEEPVRNLDAWTERQYGIAQAFQGDSVVDPPRIMRVAGTINFPPPHKLQRGYRVERVAMRSSFAEERAPVSPEQIATAYPRATVSNVERVEQGQTTLAVMRRTRVQDLLDACTRGDQWHNNMVRLVAHMASIGRTSAEILALADHITLSGYTVDGTRREMQTALQGARFKWSLPEPQDDVSAEEATREDADSIFPLLDLDELEAMPPPTWLIHGILPEEGLAIIYGDPGAGKSFIALDMALRVVMGFDWHGEAVKLCGVLYIAGEGSRGIGKRVKGWRRQHGMEGADAPFLLLPIAVQMLDRTNRAKLLRTISAAIQRAGFAIGLIIVDTVSRALAGADENAQDAMSAFVAACDEVRAHIGAGVLVLGVHHSGKNKEAGMRGSTVLIGACETSIRITKDEETKRATLKTEKQKDDEEAAPIYMEMRKVTWATGLEEEQSTLVPFRAEATVTEQIETGISKQQIYETFKAIEEGWLTGKPWSIYPQNRAEGRYLPEWMHQKFGLKLSAAAALIGAWQMNGLLEMDKIDTRNGKQGLKILQWHGVPE